MVSITSRHTNDTCMVLSSASESFIALAIALNIVILVAYYITITEWLYSKVYASYLYSQRWQSIGRGGI